MCRVQTAWMLAQVHIKATLQEDRGTEKCSNGLLHACCESKWCCLTSRTAC
jgi:hypothetical protein